MALNEVLEEIRGSRRDADDVSTTATPPVEPNDKRRQKTKEEIEAYKARKIREEEARYLRDQKKGVGRRKTKKTKSVKSRRMKKVIEKTASRSRTGTQTHPKMLQPLQPLYLLKIPGMSKGDCLAICLAHTEN